MYPAKRRSWCVLGAEGRGYGWSACLSKMLRHSMSDQNDEPQEPQREPVRDKPLSLVPQSDATDGAGRMDELIVSAGTEPAMGQGGAVASGLEEAGGRAPQGPPAEGARAPRAPKELSDMTPAELRRHAEQMLVKGIALLGAHLVDLVTQGQRCQDPVQVVDMLAKLKDIMRADYWDEKLGKTILEQRDPKLLAQGAAGPLLHKLAGKMQAIKKAAAGDGRTTPEKLRKDADGPRPMASE